jgi:hypothetical protein
MSGSFVHKIIIAGCRCFDGPLPSGPHKRTNMRIPKQRASAHRRNRLVLVGLVGAALLTVAVFALIPQLSRSDVETPSTGLSEQQQPLLAPSSTIEVRDEVVGRLIEIFRVRDRAIQTRNARLLDALYTPDCPCLEGDRELIRRLKQEQLVWRGINVSLDVQKVERVNDQLWTVSALVTTSPFEIVKESGVPVRRIPQGQEVSRFALARPIGQQDWLLGQASVIEKRD